MVWQLCTELLPAHEAGANGLAVLSNDFLVSGADDRMVAVWRRVSPTAFACVSMLADANDSVRGITAIPPRPEAGFPSGGFAVASLDKAVRLYSLDPSTNAVTLIRVLTGHTGGVVTLGWTAGGALLSGSWDGTARVWDVTTGACLAVLPGHENGVCVAGLPDGRIVTGSTGRKNEANQHVDYRVRIWAGDGSSYAVAALLEDHDQAVRDAAVLADGSGFVTVGNDGAVKVRALADGKTTATFLNPISEEGKPWSAFRVAVAPFPAGTRGTLIVSCEDNTLRLCSPSGDVEAFALPGTPWGAAALPCGDVAVACGQAGTSRRGHVYVITADASRCGAAVEGYDLLMARFTKDCEPPSKARVSSAASESGLEGIQINGAYEDRASLPGASEGQYGFFKRGSDGAVMACAWSAQDAAWMDIGVVQEGGADGGSGGGGSSAGAGPASDYSVAVTVDTARGARSLTLRFNEADDPSEVARSFCDANGISLDNYEEIRNFVIDQKAAKSASRAAAAKIQHFSAFPSSAFAELATIDWAKVCAKLAEVSGGLPTPLTDAQLAAFNASIAVAGDPKKYHSGTVPRAGIAVLLETMLGNWPPAALLPAVDALRALLCHPDASAAVAAAARGGGSTLLADTLCGRILPAALADVAGGRAVALVALRACFNAFRHGPMRRAAVAALPALLGAAEAGSAHPHATVRFAATVLLHNIAHALFLAREEHLAGPMPGAAGSSSCGLAPSDLPAAAEATIRVIAGAGLRGLAPGDDAAAASNLVTALGTVVVLEPARYVPAARAALAAAGGDPLGSLAGAYPSLGGALSELRGVLSSR